MQKGRLIYSTASFSLSLVLTGLLTVALTANPFSGFYLLSAGLFLLPFFLQLVFRCAGPLSALASLVLLCFGISLKNGASPALFAIGYLAPPLVAYACCLYRGVSAYRAMAIIALVYGASVLLLYALSFRVLGEAPFDALSRLAVQALQSMPERDGLLITATRFGLLSIPESLSDSAVIQSQQGGATLSPELLEELYKQVQARLGIWLRALVPSLISSYAPWLALGGVHLSEFYGKRQAERRAFRAPQDSPAPSYPRLEPLPVFHRFHLPASLSKPLLAAGGLAFLTRFSSQQGLALAGAMLYNIFSALFSLQGLSCLNHMQKTRGVRPSVRGLSIAAFTLLLPHASLILGIFDQLSDPRKLRHAGDSTKSDQDDTGRDGQ